LAQAASGADELGCNGQRLYEHYLDYYLPFVRSAPKDVRDFTALSMFLSNLDGFPDGSPLCASVGKNRSVHDNACRKGSACLQAHVEVPYFNSSTGTWGSFTSPVGCEKNPCCFNLFGSLRHDEKGCKSLALGSGLDPGDLCTTGYCDDSEPDGKCGCNERTTWDAYQAACLVADPKVYYTKADESCPDDYWPIGGGCYRSGSKPTAQGHLPNGEPRWKCTDSTAGAYTICSPNIDIIQYGNTNVKLEKQEANQHSSDYYWHDTVACKKGQLSSYGVQVRDNPSYNGFHILSSGKLITPQAAPFDKNGFTALCLQNVGDGKVNHYVQTRDKPHTDTTDSLEVACANAGEVIVGGHCTFSGDYSGGVKISLETRESYPISDSDGKPIKWYCKGGLYPNQAKGVQSHTDQWPVMSANVFCMPAQVVPRSSPSLLQQRGTAAKSAAESDARLAERRFGLVEQREGSETGPPDGGDGGAKDDKDGGDGQDGEDGKDDKDGGDGKDGGDQDDGDVAPSGCPDQIPKETICAELTDVIGLQGALYVVWKGASSKSPPEGSSSAAVDVDAAVLKHYIRADIVGVPADVSTNFRVDGMQVSKGSLSLALPSDTNLGVKVSVFATIMAEQGKDKELVEYNRKLGVSASSYQTLSANQKKEGVTSVEQLGAEESALVSDGVDADDEAIVAGRIDRASTTTTMGPEHYSQAEKNRMKELNDAQDAMVKQAKEIQDQLEDIVSKGKDQTEEEAAQHVKDIQNALDQFAVQAADLDGAMSGGEGDIDKLMGMQNGDLREGKDLTISEMMNQLGLFRGVVISNARPTEALAETAVELTGSYARAGAEAFRRRILTKSDLLDYEFSMSFSSAFSAQTAEKLMKTQGYSSCSAFSESLSGAAFFSGGRGSFSESSTGSRAHGHTEQDNSEDQNSMQISDFYKRHWIVAPAFALHVDRRHLKASAALREDVRRLREACPESGEKDGVCKTDSEDALGCMRLVSRLFEKYGTHVCPSVTIGGMYLGSAEVHSVSTMSTVEMDNVVSDATSKALSVTTAMSFASPFASGSASGGYSGSKDTHDAYGSKTDNMFQNQTYTAQVSFSSLGGQGGLSFENWRKSLAYSSNWAVTDRAIDSCIPLWDVARASDTSAEFNCTAQRMYDYYLTYYLPFFEASAEGRT